MMKHGKGTGKLVSVLSKYLTKQFLKTKIFPWLIAEYARCYLLVTSESSLVGKVPLPIRNLSLLTAVLSVLEGLP